MIFRGIASSSILGMQSFHHMLARCARDMLNVCEDVGHRLRDSVPTETVTLRVKSYHGKEISQRYCAPCLGDERGATNGLEIVVVVLKDDLIQ